MVLGLVIPALSAVPYQVPKKVLVSIEICPVRGLSANAWNTPTWKQRGAFMWRNHALMQPVAAFVFFLVHHFLAEVSSSQLLNY